MRRVAYIVVAALAALAIGGCGGQKRTIPTAKAQSMLQQLDAIGAQFDNGACTGAHEKVVALENDARNLSSRVDRTVRKNLVAGIQRLDSLVGRDCRKPKQPSTTTTTTPTVTTPPPTTTTPPPQTTPSQPTTPTTTPTSPTPPSTTPGNGGGGVTVTVPSGGTTGTGGTP